MSFCVLRKGEIVSTDIPTREKAQQYIEGRIHGFFGDPIIWYEIRREKKKIRKPFPIFKKKKLDNVD